MKVSELIEMLYEHPCDDEVVILYETYAERDIDFIYSRGGKLYIEAENP